jgi:hypothetical protein
VIAVSEMTEKVVAGVPPKETALAPVNALPVMVTTVPPAMVPDVGVIPVTAGTAAAVYVNRSAEDVADVPLGVVTVMSTVAAACGGAMASSDLSDTTAKLLAATVPNDTPLAPVKPLPVTVTTVPPDDEPDVGVIAVTAGTAAAVYVNRSAVAMAEVPVGVVTVTSTVPAAWGGAVTSMDVSDRIMKLVATIAPKETP